MTSHRQGSPAHDVRVRPAQARVQNSLGSQCRVDRAVPSKTRRVSLCDGDARPIRKGSLAKPTQFGYTAQITDNRQGIVIDFELEAGMPPDAPHLAPAIERAITAVEIVPDAVTADRGYGQRSVDAELDALGVNLVAVLHKGKTSQTRQAIEATDDFVELIKWRTGAEGRSPRSPSDPSRSTAGTVSKHQHRRARRQERRRHDAPEHQRPATSSGASS